MAGSCCGGLESGARGSDGSREVVMRPEAVEGYSAARMVAAASGTGEGVTVAVGAPAHARDAILDLVHPGSM